ncbi:heterokaryon incompatibility domain-containing protein [Trichoderma chlorosporum]
MSGLFTWHSGGQHEFFAKTRQLAKPPRTKKSPEDQFLYDFSSATESRLSDSQVLCQHCSVLQLKDIRLAKTKVSWRRDDPLELRADVPDVEGDLEYRRKDVVPLLPGLGESADSGCGFCALLRNAMLWHFRKYSLRRVPEDTIEITRIRHYWNSGLVAFTVHSTAFVRPKHKYGYLTFRVSATRRDPCASILKIDSEFVPDSIMSPAGIFTLKQWVLGNNKERAALKALYRPTRLINVEGRRESGLIRLVESHDNHDGIAEEPQPYIALSYCWGKKAPSLKTTRSNYSQLKKSISYDALPKTYQDTVRIARALHVKYIWIDALCIIQDDVADWERESQVMAEIFRNSLVTLIPLRARSSDDGFLERNPSIRIPYHSAEWNINGSFFVRHMPFSYEDAESAIRATFSDRPLSLEIRNSVWHTRGWTFQEDIFAIRKLYIGQLMMYWDSLKPIDIMRTEDKVIDDKLDRIDTAELSIIHSSQRWRGDSDYEGWYYPMLQYNKKRLTYEADRLPAVSSYAKLIASKSKDQYLAGLWKKNLHRGLLWKMHRGSRGKFGEMMRSLVRPPKYVAPSWSWASRPGSLTLDNSDRMELECEVVKAKTRASGEDAYGRVSGGNLLLRGKACGIPGGKLQKLPLKSPFLHVQCEWLAAEDERYVAQCALDWRETNEDGTQLSEASGDTIQSIVMFLTSSGHTTTPSAFSRRPQEWEDKEEDPPLEVMHGLLLYPTGKREDEYWRVGLFHSLADEKGGRQYFSQCEERTLRIV